MLLQPSSDFSEAAVVTSIAEIPDPQCGLAPKPTCPCSHGVGRFHPVIPLNPSLDLVSKIDILPLAADHP